MSRRRWPGFALGVLAGALGVWLALRPELTTRPPAAQAADLPTSRRNAIVTASQKVSPAVVSVSVVATRTVRADPFAGMLRDDFFDRFFPPMEYEQKIPGLGSGVIIDPSGIVLTNGHVVRNAQEVKVTLADGRQLPAKILGTTDLYDLAVLKVEGRNLPAAPMGNSDELVVGEWAIAIGSPFGYLLNDTQPTVTAGVVSATRRDIKSEVTESGMYKNMIQTDAAINPGNSGGPLVNAEGEVIGINTFIFTQGGGSIGLGFAIPINLARRILQEIKTYGRVRTAWPGMTLQQVTPYIAQRLGFKDLGGMVVSRVEPGGPAARAGVQVGDRIRKVNGRDVDSVDDAQRSIYGAAVGDQLKLVVEREGRTQNVSLTLAEAPRGGREP